MPPPPFAHAFLQKGKPCIVRRLVTCNHAHASQSLSPSFTIPFPLFVIIAHSWRRRRQRNVAQTPPSRRRMRIGALYLGSLLTAAALFSCAQEKSSETSGGCEKARLKLQAETCERAVAKVPRDCSCADVIGQNARRSRTQPQNQRRILDV